MKNIILVSVVSLALLYLIKKGDESAEEKGESLNFIETIKRGFALTVASWAKAGDQEPGTADNTPGFVDDLPGNSEMVSFTPQLNSFRSAHLKSKRGTFHGSTIRSIN